MSERGIRHIPIVGDNNELIGLVTQRDLLKAGTSSLGRDQIQQIDEASIPVEQIMTKNVSFVHPKDALRVAGLKLQKEKFGCLPVVENNQIVGIITDTDFVGVAIDLIEHMDIVEDNEF